MTNPSARLSPKRDEILRVEAVTKMFGGVHAVRECTIAVEKASITGLIGPNGSGKTTLFNILTGMSRANSGRVRFRDHDITGLKPHVIFRLGMSRTFQITRLFPKMTVLENLRVSPPRVEDGSDRAADANELLELFNLSALRDRYAEDLSYGQMKLLELARALVSKPHLVMLDEPFAGVNRVMATKLVDLIRRFQEQGTTFCLIDHEMKIVMELCDSIYAMDFGEIVAAGRPDEIRKDPRVLEAYFGR